MELGPTRLGSVLASAPKKLPFTQQFGEESDKGFYFSMGKEE